MLLFFYTLFSSYLTIHLCYSKSSADYVNTYTTVLFNNPTTLGSGGPSSHMKYGFLEGSCVIPNKAAYMDDETWEKVVKVVAPGIRKMMVRNVLFV